VQWSLYVLKKNRTSNKQLHELAREIKGVEKRRGRKFTTRQYRLIFDKWAAASKPHLSPDHDYFTEFLAKLDCVTVPRGETLQAAFERAKVEIHQQRYCWFQTTASDYLRASAESFTRWPAVRRSC
jgi:hypothetical protein